MDEGKTHAADEHATGAARDEMECSRLGDYELLEQIGRGGMGTVYRARHVLLNQIAAVKVLPASLLGDTQAIERFRREMLSTGGLNHPNLVRALNAGADRGYHFLVTEFVDGITLRELVGRTGELPIGTACELVRQAAVGLQHVHVNSLVHRDIKPANLMLSRDGTVKILDLGLARDQSSLENRESTQSGRAMGTVDYMAPEQWLHADSVDIRADIYSLGCTLFFLLTGRAPMEADPGQCRPRNDALAVSHPSLDISDHRPDCPAELVRVLDRMLAEDANERSSTPAQVAHAIRPFADPRQLDELLSALPHVPKHSDRTDAAGRNDTRDAPSSGSPTSPPGSTTRTTETPTATRRRVLRLGATVAGLAIVLVGWLCWMLGTRETSPQPAPGSSEASVVLASTSEIRGLPGLNGPWWFDESPWLSPFVRQAIADDLVQGPLPTDLPFIAGPGDNPALSSDVEAMQDWLLGLARRSQARLSTSELTLFDELVRISQDDLKDDPLAGRLEAALDRFVAENGQDGTNAAWSAADLHMRAVLQHKIAAIRSDRTLAETSAASYAAALAAYRSLDTKVGSLTARCLVDAAQLYSRVFKDYAQAKQRYRDARAVPGAPLLLQVEAWVGEAVASAVANPDSAEKYTEAGFACTSALDLLDESLLQRNSHPMAAHVHERYAWILMDQWNVRKAAAEFKDAHSIRLENFRKSKNDFAQIFVFHNDHGQAMAERYNGDVKGSRAQYDLVIGEVAEALAKAETEPERLGIQRFRRDLRERYSNSCERRADCELYQGAASGFAVDLDEAARLYTLARDYADDPAVQTAMSCKRAIVLAMAGQVAEAEREFYQERVTQQTVIGIQEERLRLLRALAAAVLKTKSPDTESGLTALRAFLRQFDLDPNYPDRHRRETQELQLLAAELLIASELNDPTKQSVLAADAEYLDRLITAFPYRDQMLPYLRRYYDLLIAAREHGDPDRTAGYILASRGLRPVPDTTLVLFHLTTGRGRVIVRTTDAQCRRFSLDFGREDVKAAGAGATAARPIGLPAQLIELLAGEREADRPIAVYWDDGNCWASAEDCLTEEDWPFDGQLGYDGSIR